MSDSIFSPSRAGAAAWHALDLRPHERIAEGLRRQLTTPALPLLEIAQVRQPEDGYSYREDVAYVLRAESKTTSAAVSIIFLRSHPGPGRTRRVEYCVYEEGEIPHAFDCPPAWLVRLAPPQDAGARIWREQCWQRVRHPLRDGDVVTFHSLAPGLAGPATPSPYRVEWPIDSPYPSFVHLASGQRSTTPLWRMLPYTLHYRGELELASGVCSECGVALGGPGAVCAGCVCRFLLRRAEFSEYVRALEARLAQAPYCAIWAPDRFVEGAGYYLSLLPAQERGKSHRFSKIDLYVPGGGDEMAQVWLGGSIEDAVQQAVEAVGGFPLAQVPVESWTFFDPPHPTLLPLYLRRPGAAPGAGDSSWRGGD
jgi:hypothetical protein